MSDLKFLDVKGLVKYIPLSKSTIYKKVSRNEIPHFKIGARTLFEIEKIDEWVRSGGTTDHDLPQLPEV